MSLTLDINNPEISRIGHQAEVDFCHLMAKYELDSKDIVAISGGLLDPVLNVVIDAQTKEKGLPQKIDAVIAFYEQLNAPWTWVVKPDITKPSSLPQFLIRQNLILLDNYPGMYFDLTRINREDLPPNIDIRELHADDDLSHWVESIQEGFPSSDNGDGFRKINADLPHGPGTSLRHYCVYFRGQPIAAGTLYIGKESVMIQNLATKRDFRGKGYATKLILYMLHLSKRLGFSHCFLDSSKRGYLLYRRLGFKVYCLNDVYGFENRGY